MGIPFIPLIPFAVQVKSGNSYFNRTNNEIELDIDDDKTNIKQ